MRSGGDDERTHAGQMCGDVEEAEKLCRLLMSPDEAVREQGKALMGSLKG